MFNYKNIKLIKKCMIFGKIQKIICKIFFIKTSNNKKIKIINKLTKYYHGKMKKFK